jgi:NCS2 family nucleobase:cation symporter-2/xanthine permease XanP
MFRKSEAKQEIQFEPDENCPPLRAITSALQIFLPNTISLVMLAALVVQASGESEAYLSWMTFTVLAVTGVSMVLQSLRLRYVGSGRLIVTNFNVPFLAVSALALHVGGPGLLATLIVASTLVQSVLTLHLASLRRIFTPTVSGVVVMLVAVSAMPFIISRAVIPLEGHSTLFFLAPGMAALAAGILLSLQETLVWRIWILPVTVTVGLIVALPLGLYNTDIIIATPWVSLPAFWWPGLDLAFGADFWTLLPVFVIVNLTAFVKAVGDLSVIQRASYRSQSAVDFRSVQGGLNVYGMGTMVSGLLGTLPVAAPWAVTVVYIGFTGVASRSVGIYLGLFTMATATFSKLLAVLVAIPSTVVGAVYIVIFGMLFVEGAKTVFTGPADHKRAAITGVSMVLGLSAGALSRLFDGTASHLVGNTIVTGGMAAIGMTAVTELTGIRGRKLRTDLSQSSLTAVDDFLRQFAEANSWTDEGKYRLRLVGEEVMLNLIDGESSNPAERKRSLVATIRPQGGSAELEIVVASDDAIQGNIENRIAYLGQDEVLEEEQQMSVRILRHYASSIHHRKYYGIDVVSCRVEK